MRAEVAFCSSVVIRMNVNRIVGTGLHARFAAYAPIAIKINYAIFSLPESGDRANFHTGSVRAMIATLHRKNSAGAWKFTLFDVLNPRAIYADRQVMFLFTGNSTGMTSNALAIVDDEPVVH
jgi:hypothetical protein